MSCLTLCDPIDGNIPGSSVQRIIQARILEWLSLPSPENLLEPGVEPTSLVSLAFTGMFGTTSATSSVIL